MRKIECYDKIWAILPCRVNDLQSEYYHHTGHNRDKELQSNKTFVLYV